MIHYFQGQIIRYTAISLLLTLLLAQAAVRRGHDKEQRIPAHSLTECHYASVQYGGRASHSEQFLMITALVNVNVLTVTF